MSNSILKQLYYSDVRPIASQTCIHTHHRELSSQIIDIYQSLKQGLPDEQHKQLDELQDFYSERSNIELESAFVEGFRLGAQLIMDIQNRDIAAMGNISISVCRGGNDD